MRGVSSATGPRLVAPSVEYEQSFRDAVAEIGPDCAEYERIPRGVPFKFFVQTLVRLDTPARGGIPHRVRWLVDGDRFLGRVQIAHELSEDSADQGGHINYVIRPSERGKGYGRRILELALEEAQAIGLSRVLLTVLSDNPASEAIIVGCGGSLSSATDLPNGVQRRRFVISVA